MFFTAYCISAALVLAQDEKQDEIKEYTPEEIIALYESVEKLPLLDFTKNSRKFALITKHRGKTVLIRVKKNTFDYEKGEEESLAWLSRYKGYTVWVRNEEHANKEGYFKAVIPETFPWLRGSGSDDFEVMEITDMIYPTDDLMRDLKQARKDVGKK